MVQFPDTDLLRITIKRDSEGRILRKIETEAHGGSKTTYDYVYDDAGRLALVLRNGMETERYEYDKAGRRIAGTSEAFGMRPVTLEYDGMHLTRCGDTTYGYAADGTLRDRHDAGGTTWFLYAGDTGLDGAVLPDGRTFSWQTNGTTGQPLIKHEGDTPVERYRWRDLVRLERHDDLRRGISQHYHYAEGSRLPHAMTEYQGGQSASYTLGYDQVGTLKAVADMDGKLVKQRQYDSFGNLLYDTTPNWFIPIGFAGGVHDRDTGLVRFGRRDYDPQYGRFVAQDPLGDTGGDHDLYEYCVDDPINAVDPTGENPLLALLPLFLGGKALAAGIAGLGVTAASQVVGNPKVKVKVGGKEKETSLNKAALAGVAASKVPDMAMAAGMAAPAAAASAAKVAAKAAQTAGQVAQKVDTAVAGAALKGMEKVADTVSKVSPQLGTKVLNPGTNLFIRDAISSYAPSGPPEPSHGGLAGGLAGSRDELVNYGKQAIKRLQKDPRHPYMSPMLKNGERGR